MALQTSIEDSEIISLPIGLSDDSTYCGDLTKCKNASRGVSIQNFLGNSLDCFIRKRIKLKQKPKTQLTNECILELSESKLAILLKLHDIKKKNVYNKQVLIIPLRCVLIAFLAKFTLISNSYKSQVIQPLYTSQNCPLHTDKLAGQAQETSLDCNTWLIRRVLAIQLGSPMKSCITLVPRW